MPCPVCSSDSVFEAARKRRSEPAFNLDSGLTSEVLSMAQEVRDISSRLRHKTGADPEAADMLDALARRMARARAAKRLAREPCARRLTKVAAGGSHLDKRLVGNR